MIWESDWEKGKRPLCSPKGSVPFVFLKGKRPLCFPLFLCLSLVLGLKVHIGAKRHASRDALRQQNAVRLHIVNNIITIRVYDS